MRRGTQVPNSLRPELKKATNIAAGVFLATALLVILTKVGSE